MKCSNQAIALFLIACQLIIFTNTKILPITPKGETLSNHYGTAPEAGQFGPQPNIGANLRREGILPGEKFTPITNFNQQINPSAVVAGDLDNTAYDSSKIISAPLAKPKVEITASIEHEAVVKTPVHIGNRVEEKTVKTMNRLTGKVESKSVETKKPIMGVLNTPRVVTTMQKTTYDVESGKIIPEPTPLSNEGKNLHGKN